jgi:hypothetical protein
VGGGGGYGRWEGEVSASGLLRVLENWERQTDKKTKGKVGAKQRVERVETHVLDLEPGMTKTESRSTGGSSHHDEYERVDFGWDVCSNKK